MMPCMDSLAGGNSTTSPTMMPSSPAVYTGGAAGVVAWGGVGVVGVLVAMWL
jgi:hypothetical protein